MLGVKEGLTAVYCVLEFTVVTRTGERGYKLGVKGWSVHTGCKDKDTAGSGDPQTPGTGRVDIKMTKALKREHAPAGKVKSSN